MWSPLLFNKTPLEPGPLLAERKLDRSTLAERKLDRVHHWRSENWTGSTFGRAKTGPGPLLAERKLNRVHFWLSENWTGSTFGRAKTGRVCILLRRQSANHSCSYIVLQAFQGRGRMTSSIPFLLVMQRISSSNVHVATNLVGDVNSRKA